MSATGKPIPRDCAGFTLIEMLAALAIMALIAGIAFPALQARAGSGALLAARGEVSLAVAQARGDAIARGAPVRVAWDGAGALVSSSGRRSAGLPPGVSLEWPEGGLAFYPDGSASGGGGAIHARALVSRFDVAPGTGALVFAQ